MARKRTLIDELATMPWWFNLALSVVVYLILKHWLPSIEYKSPAVKSMAGALSSFAGMFALFLVFLAGISAFNSWRRGELFRKQTSVRSLKSLSWKNFETLVGEYYRRLGYRVYENISGGPDGGIDLVLRNDTEHLLVQCKNWKSKRVGVKAIRELLGVVVAEKATGGVLVCSGEFTDDAMEFARPNNIQLVNGETLAHRISGINQQPSFVQSRDDPSCPVCGGDMVERVAKRGKNLGRHFLGCSKYPRCRGTRTLPVK